MLHCSPHGLLHLPHISNTHAASSSSVQYLDKSCLNFFFSYSMKDTSELLIPSSWGTPLYSGIFLFVLKSSFPFTIPTSCKQNSPCTTWFNSCPANQRGLQHLLVLHVPCLLTPTPLPLPHSNMLKASL